MKKNKHQLFDIILFSLAVAFTLIGIHQVVVGGFMENYWIFMLSIALIIWYNYRKNQAQSSNTPSKNKSKRKKP